MLTLSWTSCFPRASSQRWAAANREQEPGPHTLSGAEMGQSCFQTLGEGAQTPQPQLTSMGASPAGNVAATPTHQEQ